MNTGDIDSNHSPPKNTKQVSIDDDDANELFTETQDNNLSACSQNNKDASDENSIFGDEQKIPSHNIVVHSVTEKHLTTGQINDQDEKNSETCIDTNIMFGSSKSG